MKILSKILTAALVLSMFAGITAFAKTYPDVDSDADYAEAVNAISDLGIAVGDDKGNFNADKTLTRAEGTAFVLRLLGLEEAAKAAAGTATAFSDVPANHWAAGYVSVVAANGIVSGMGDGTFAPNNPLTYAQIVRMLVSALGYESLAKGLGEWPNNYILAASRINLTTDTDINANDVVTRGTTAKLIYAALAIPINERNFTDNNSNLPTGNSSGNGTAENAKAKVDYESKMFIVSKVSKTSIDDYDYTLLNGYQNGKEAQYMASDDKDLTALYNIKLNGTTLTEGAAINVKSLKKGDILFVAADSDGIITTGVVFNNVLTPKDVTAKVSDAVTDGKNNGCLVTGYVLGATDNKVYIGKKADSEFDTDNPGNAYFFTADDNTLVTVYDSSKKLPLYKGTLADIGKNGSIAFARLNSSEKAMEIVVFADSSKISNINIEDNDDDTIDNDDKDDYDDDDSTSSSVNYESDMFIVSKVSKTSVDDYDYTLLTGYQNGKEAQYMASDDKDLTVLYKINLNGKYVTKGKKISAVSKGDILFIVADSDNIIDTGVVFNNVLTPKDVTAKVSDAVTDGKNNGGLVTGYVLGVADNKVYIGKKADSEFDEDKPGNAYFFTADDNTLVTVYDASKKSPLGKGTVADIGKNGSIAFARLNSSEKAMEIVVFTDSSKPSSTSKKDKISNDDKEEYDDDNTSSSDAYESNMFTVSKVYKTFVDDETYILLRGSQNGKEVQYRVSEDSEVTVLYKNNSSGEYATEAKKASDISKGDILLITEDSDDIFID